LNTKAENYIGKKVTIMGLGLHGGGLASALFFAENGAELTVTDLKTEEQLKPSLEKLSAYRIKYTLGRHEEKDFAEADIVIKNPGVPSSSPWLKLAKRVETDVSIFLSCCSRPIIAVTGSKGKSTVASCIFNILKSAHDDARLGGNITVSPLVFLLKNRCLDKQIKGINQESFSIDTGTGSTVPVVLELSSWQLADLKNCGSFQPAVSVITNIMHDHQNAYTGMKEYADDKAVIFRKQNSKGCSIFNYDDEWGKGFAEEAETRKIFFSASGLPENTEGGWLEEKRAFLRLQEKEFELDFSALKIKGSHNKINLLTAALAAALYGIEKPVIQKALNSFTGIEHRMEFAGSKNGISFYNDSAATIPEAALAAVSAFEKAPVLITGGTDKKLDFDIYKEIASKCSSIHILDGTAGIKIAELLENNGIKFTGPHKSLKQAFETALAAAGNNSTIVLSPGCASFGMFENEFDRGRQFKALTEKYLAGEL
jgi:UDP-N-acetylmuramoylalanine--D-glutamate ligase